MAKKTTRSTTPESQTSEPMPERRRKARTTARTGSTAPEAVIAQPESSSAVERHTANEKLTQGDGHPSPTFEEIAEAAYQRYLQRGGQHGNDFDDWIDAERSLRRRSAK